MFCGNGPHETEVIHWQCRLRPIWEGQDARSRAQPPCPRSTSICLSLLSYTILPTTPTNTLQFHRFCLKIHIGMEKYLLKNIETKKASFSDISVLFCHGLRLQYSLRKGYRTIAHYQQTLVYFICLMSLSSLERQSPPSSPLHPQ